MVTENIDETRTFNVKIYNAPNQDNFGVYDGSNWRWLDHFEYFKVKKKQNQVSEFEVKIYDIKDAEKAYLKIQAEVMFFAGSKMILKGRIQSIEYGSTYECIVKGFGMESLLLDKEFIKAGDNRIEYTNESAQTVAQEILTSSTTDLTTASSGLWAADYGDVSLRYEYANRLNAMGKLSEAIDYNWWVSQTDSDFYDADYFHVASTQGDTTDPNLVNHWKLNETTGTTVSDNIGSNDGTVKVRAVGYYPFDGNADDESYNSHDGTTSTATLTTDRFGASNKAYSFDGGDNIRIDDDPEFDLTSSGTVAYWVLWDNTSLGFRRIVDKEVDTPRNGWTTMWYTGSTNVGIEYWDNDLQRGGVRTDKTDWVTGSWYHLAYAWDEDGTSIYVDGVLDTSSASAPGIGLNTLSTFIGNSSIGGGGHIGKLDDVIIKSQKLVATEIEDLYNMTKVHDLRDPWVTGKIDNCAELNSISQIDLDSSVTLASDSSSVAFWVNITDNMKDEGSVIMSDYPGSVSFTRHLVLYNEGGASKMFFMEPNTNLKEIYWPEPSTLTGWHHFCFVAGSTAKLYLDGVDQGEPTSTEKAVFDDYNLGAIVGGGGHASSHYGWNETTKVDDVRIYNTPLTQNKVSEIYNYGTGSEHDTKKYFSLGNNAVKTEQDQDLNNMTNYVKILGYGDGVNQLNTSVYAASTQSSVLSANINLTDSSIAVVNATPFAASGTVRIAEEQVTYAGISANTLTGCSRGVNSTTAKAHNINCYIEEQHALTSSEAGSSIDTYGLMDYTIINRNLIDEKTAEVIASKYLIDRKTPIIRIKINPDEPLKDAGELNIGDLITIEDAESDLDGEFRVVGLNYVSNYGFLELEIEVSNRSLEFIEQMNKTRERQEEAQKYMQGATNIYAISEAENCNNAVPLNMRFFVPTEAVAINTVTLKYKPLPFRIYSAEGATSVNQEITTVAGTGSSVSSVAINSNAWTNIVSVTTSANDCEGVFLNYGAQFVSMGGVQPTSVASGALRWRIYDGTNYYPNAGGNEILNGGQLWNNNPILGGPLAYYVPGNNTSSAYTLQLKWDGWSNDIDWVFNASGAYTQYSRHTHDTAYGMFEDTFPTTASMSVDVGVEGSESSVTSSQSIVEGGEYSLDITDEVSAAGAGNWVNIKFTPTGSDHTRMRVESDAYVQIFIQSK